MARVRGDRREHLIRSARPQEAGELRALVSRAYARYIERIGRRPAPMDADYESLIRDGLVHVAEDRGALAGLIVLIPHADHLLIDNVAVEPARQGEGIGRGLLGFAERCARERGLPELRLYTNVAMTENLALYPRLGYRETDRRVEGRFERVFFAKPTPPG